MQLGKMKSVATALFLVMILAALSAGSGTVAATEYVGTWPTHLYLLAAPNPVGVGQTINVLFWFNNGPPESMGAAYFGWQGTILTITHPDGTVETQELVETETTGSGYYHFIPEETGVYKFQANFPGQEVNVTGPWMFVNLQVGLHYFQSSQSKTVEVTVQAEEIQSWPEVPLPDGYWTRPISAENREWYNIAGNWLASTGFAEYTQAPETAHILWTEPLAFGGLVGGQNGYGENYFAAPPYSTYLAPPVIISGRLYYNVYPQGGLTAAKTGVVCVDLRTGEELWRDDSMPKLVCGQALNINLMAGYGSRAYLWVSNGSSLLMYDAFTGGLISEVQGAGGLSPTYGPNGEILVYAIDGVNNRLTMWNSTKALTDPHPATNSAAQEWTPLAKTTWNSGIQLNVSIPTVSGGTVAMAGIDYSDGVIIGEAPVTATMTGTNPTFTQVGYDTTTGNQLWAQNRTGYDWGFFGMYKPGLISRAVVGEGVYSFFQKETMQWHVFNVKTGSKLWSTKPLSTYTNSDYSMYDWMAYIAYGKLYTAGYTGSVCAFDIKTGDFLWIFSQGNSGVMTPFGSWPDNQGLLIADDTVLLPASEHTPNSPILRGYRLYGINATSGEKLWSVPCFISSWGLADGVLVGWNCYDNQVYAFGKGKTETTVSAPDIAVTLGSSIMIKGAVTDQSPGARGTPAVSDASMSDWMAYLYQQQPYPANATGVEVSLDVLDENGNYRNIGTATSDASGVFSYAWKPDIPGTYTVYATFAGSGAYYSSYAETAFVVDEAPAATVEPTPAPQSAADMYFIPMSIGIIVAIVVATIVIVLMLRKR